MQRVPGAGFSKAGGVKQVAGTLFMMGNKRSGTSLLVRLLNVHPRVFITHESDVIWTLYQCRSGLPDRFDNYSGDGPLGMIATLRAATEVYRRIPAPGAGTPDLVQAFFDIQEHLRLHGSDVQQTYPGKKDLSWVGDKKPVQHADPELHEFILELWPDARFIHVVRHPCAVYQSIQAAKKNWTTVPEYWKGDDADIFGRWLRHERWVLDAMASLGDAGFSLRYEDIVARPVEELQRCFDWLGLDMGPDVRSRVAAMLRKPNSANEPMQSMAVIEGLEDMMARYGYGLDGSVRQPD